MAIQKRLSLMAPAASRLKNGSPESLSLLEDQVVFNFLRGLPSLASEGADFLTETNATFFTVNWDFVFVLWNGLLQATLLLSAVDCVGLMDELEFSTLLPSAGERPLGDLSSFIPFSSAQSFTSISVLISRDWWEDKMIVYPLFSSMEGMNSSLVWFAGAVSHLNSSFRHGSGVWQRHDKDVHHKLLNSN